MAGGKEEEAASLALAAKVADGRRVVAAKLQVV
jgi:hypothetical protein